MGRFFALDSPIMNFLNKLADLIWLNILAMICCIPIVTIGASITALNYVALKMVKDEESYVTKAYFKSFKENFIQSTLEWLLILFIFGILFGDLLIFRLSGLAFPYWLRIAVIAIGVLVLFCTAYVFPLQARYENKIWTTFKNSIYMGILNLPKTLLMMICWALPVLVILFIQQALPLIIMLGISGPVFLNALIYKKTFKRFEPEEEIVSDMDWTVAPIEGEEQAENEIKEESGK